MCTVSFGDDESALKLIVVVMVESRKGREIDLVASVEEAVFHGSAVTGMDCSCTQAEKQSSCCMPSCALPESVPEPR